MASAQIVTWFACDLLKLVAHTLKAVTQEYSGHWYKIGIYST